MNVRAHRVLSAAPPLLMLAAMFGCIEPMSVGLSPLATVDANITAEEDASLADAGPRDAGPRVDSGARPVHASIVDADASKAPDATILEAGLPDAGVRDAAVRDAAVRDAAADAGPADGGIERCEERLCAIAGISPRDTSCPSGQESACLREESGMCSWYCL